MRVYSFRLEKDPKKLESSVFYWDTLSIGGRSDLQGSVRPLAEIPQKFWTFLHDPKNESKDPQGMTLGKCLLLIFEKAINVHYSDYLNRLDKA